MDQTIELSFVSVGKVAFVSRVRGATEGSFQSKLATYSQQRQLIEIDYQFGNGSTSQMLSLWHQGEDLEAEVMKADNKRSKVIRTLLQLTNYESIESRRKLDSFP